MATEQEYNDILCYKTSTIKYRPGLNDNKKRNIIDKASKVGPVNYCNHIYIHALMIYIATQVICLFH